MKRQQTVWVRNNGIEKFVDKYDGENFEVLPGEAVEMLVECAELTLGFGQEDKTRALRRKGWAFTNIGMQEAIAKLQSFSFHMSEKEALEHEPNKAPAPARSAVHSSAPVVDGAAAGGSSLPPAEAAVQPKAARKPGPLEKLAQANAAG